MEKEIGKISHWFDKISVGVILLNDTLQLGDTIRIKRGNEEFEETVSSMQIDHKEVEGGKKGDEVALKFSQKAKPDSIVYLV